MKYKTLLFDLDGTIFDYSKAETAALFGAYKFVFSTVPPHNLLEVYQDINSSLWAQFERGEIEINNLKKRRFTDLFAHFELNSNSSVFSEIYLKELGNGGYLLDGALDVLESCAPEFRIGAITNGIGDVQRSRMEKAGIGHYFETVIISNDVGIAKPDPGIFALALEKMNLHKKEEILMIGDSLSSDILGGINAGIDTCWINRHKEKSTEIEPVFTIADITDLLKILS